MIESAGSRRNGGSILAVTDVAIDDAVLDRLIEQFASPYDCLRELVQNGMDAGSSRIDVELHVHGEPDAAEVAFELCVIDDGCGMTEAVIDAELARLFASSKRNDRTKAGGFGVGFVSVFAWQPDTVLLQTGRHGEAWELEFDRKARFAKQRLAQPIEGTTIRLVRRGRRDEHATVAAAARASLWRWCRFCPVEITFTDVATGETTEIRDVEVAPDAAVAAAHQTADSHVRVAFAVPPRCVLLRQGLVLAEGPPHVLLPRVFEGAGPSAMHVQIWADSPSLSTDISRDHVVDDVGRKLVEQRATDLLERARLDLLDALVSLTALPTWTPEIAARHAFLHSHLALERGALGRKARRAPIIRLVDGRACSFADLVDDAKWGVVEHQADASAEVVARTDGMPRVVAFPDVRGDWLRLWLTERKIHFVAAGTLVRDVTPGQRYEADLPALVADVLRTAGIAADVDVGVFSGPVSRPWGASLGDSGRVVLPPARPPWRSKVWLDPRHPVCAAAAAAGRPPIEAVAALVFGIVHWLGGDYITSHRVFEWKRSALRHGRLS